MKIYTTRQAARILKMHPDNLRKAVLLGKITGRRRNVRGTGTVGRLCFTRSDLLRYVRSLPIIASPAGSFAAGVQQGGQQSVRRGGRHGGLPRRRRIDAGEVLMVV